MESDTVRELVTNPSPLAHPIPSAQSTITQLQIVPVLGNRQMLSDDFARMQLINKTGEHTY